MESPTSVGIVIYYLVLDIPYLTKQLLFEYLSFLYQRTPLYIAAKEGYEYTVKYLVQKGADANLTDNEGVSMWKIQAIQITLPH